MKSQTRIKDEEKSVDESVNDSWGDWVEQDPTEGGSNEWFEDQRRKEKEVDQAVKERLKEEKLVSPLQEEPEVNEENHDERLDALAEGLRKLRGLAADFNDAIQPSQRISDKRVINFHFFPSLESTDSTLSTNEEQKNELSRNLSNNRRF
jgi:hypothetical protein